MYNNEVIKNLSSFCNNLQDGESEKLFEAWLEYFMNGSRNRDLFYERLDSVLHSRSHDYNCWVLDRYFRNQPQNSSKSFVIFGAGGDGKCTARGLRYLQRKIYCFCDNDPSKIETQINGIDVLSLDSVLKRYKNQNDIIFFIAVQGSVKMSIYYQLIRAGIKENDIIFSSVPAIYCNIPTQYFDLAPLYDFINDEGEIFVDAGCYNGMTSIQCEEFMKLRKVYAFEPGRENYALCKSNLQKLHCEFELFPCATWSRKADLHFQENSSEGYSNSVSDHGGIMISADSIDSKLTGREATFIKMDVEGSELESLKGAIQTITNYKPKLAISLYHKPEDIIQIPAFIESLNMDYKYYIRHYQTRMCETVLYAL